MVLMIRTRAILLFMAKFSLLGCILVLYGGVPAYGFSLNAVGDVNLGGKVALNTKAYGYDYPYQKTSKLLQSADITFGNLECALSSRGKPVPNKKYTFCGSPENARYLKEAGFDVLSVANNHSKDFGNQAFLDTLDLLERNNIIASGGGKNSNEANLYKIIKIKGKRVAFLSFSDILPLGFAPSPASPGIASLKNEKSAMKKVKEAKSKADFLVVSVHWGKELDTFPTPRQSMLAHELIRQGADIILGHHPHVVQGIEIYRGRVIAYSLGNFIFSPGSQKGRQSVILGIKVDNKRISDVRLYPVYIEGVRPKIITGKQGHAWLSEVSKRSKTFKTSFKIQTEKDYSYLSAAVLR